jgi:hypothetical protein
MTSLMRSRITTGKITGKQTTRRDCPDAIPRTNGASVNTGEE